MRIRFLMAVLAFGGMLAVPAQTAGVTASQAVAVLNAERVANGLPALSVDRAASRACALHDRYEKLNNFLTHVEIPGKPGYTRAGAKAAATADLSWDVRHPGGGWNQGNPFDTAPLHLAALLNPYLASIGFDDTGPWSCITVDPPDATFHPNATTATAYSYPANGRSGWPTSEVASELPFTPGDLLGLRQPRRTGPYLIVMFDGPWGLAGGQSVITSASLTGPHGTVAIKVADGTVKQHPGRPGTLGVFLGPKAMIIPVSPLSPHTKYTAQLSGKIVSFGGSPSWPVSDSFSFTTRG